MKKQSLSFVFATSTLFLATLVGCSLEEKEEAKPNHFAAPQYEVVDGEIQFNCPTDRVILVKVDEDTWQIKDSVALPMEKGNHTILAKVGCSPVTETAEVREFNYSVKEVSLDVEKENFAKVNWEAEAYEVLVDGVPSDLGYYTAVEETPITIKAVGGYDAENSIYYVGEAEETVNFEFPHTCYVIEDGEDKVSADLADEWAIAKYSNGWVTTGASIAADNGQVVFKAWNNYTTFRYSKAYSTNLELNVLAFDLTGNKNSTIKVQLMNSQYGIYATYNLGKVPAATHIELAMDDANWKMNGGSASLASSISGFGLTKIEQAIGAFDMVNFIIYGETSNGESCTVKLDNLEAKYVYGGTSKYELIPQKDLVFDFEEQKGSDKYTATNWTQTKYTTAWVECGNQMNSRTKNGSKIINVYAGWSTTFKYVYNKDGASLGTFKKASIDLGNYFSNATAMNIEFIITDVNGKDYGLLGSYNQQTYQSTWFSMPVTTAFEHFDFDLVALFGKEIEIKSFRILTKSTINGDTYLYIDNIKFSN